MNFQGPNIPLAHIMPVLLESHFAYILVKELLSGFRYGQARFSLLKLEFGHSYDDFKELVSAQLLVWIVLEIALFTLDFLEVDSVE